MDIDTIMIWFFAVSVGLLLLAPLTMLIHRPKPKPEPEPEPPKPEPQISQKLRQNIITPPKDYTAIDLETTGLNAWDDEITEVGALRIRDFNVVATYQQLVNPKRPLSKEITDITGLTDEMLANQPTLEEVLPKFLDFLGDDIMIGHNVKFDLKFIAAACEKRGLAKKDYKWIDTCDIARIIYPNIPKYSLTEICKQLKLVTPSHRVSSDLLCTNMLYVNECLKVKECNEFWPQLKLEYDTDAPDEARSPWARPMDTKFNEQNNDNVQISFLDRRREDGLPAYGVPQYVYSDVIVNIDEECYIDDVQTKDLLICIYNCDRKRPEFYKHGADAQNPRLIAYMTPGKISTMIKDYNGAKWESKGKGYVRAVYDKKIDDKSINLSVLAFYLDDDDDEIEDEDDEEDYDY